MGLDVYLYKCPDKDHAFKMEEAYNEELEKIWADWNNLEHNGLATKEEEDRLDNERAAAKLKYEIDGYQHKSRIEVCLPSKIEPDHLFKIGYLRSSYNANGINSVMRVFGLMTLYDIFNVNDNPESVIVPDWKEALENVKEAIFRYEAHLASPMGKYNVFEFSPHWQFGAKKEEDALEMFNQQVIQRKRTRFEDDLLDSGWQSRDGWFSPKPLKVVAAINKTLVVPAKDDLIGQILNKPSIYLIHENDNMDGQTWYTTALRITQETIEYVLAQKDKDQYFMVWSG